MEKRSRPSGVRDNLYIGIFLGLVFPMIGFILFYVFAFSDEMSIQKYWDTLFETSKMSGALSLSILLNLPVFFFSLWNYRHETVKGVLASTFFYGILIIFFKFS